MATITGNTKITTPISFWPPAFLLLAAALAFFAFVNLSGRSAPSDALNDRIVSELAGAASLDMGPRLQLLTRLRGEQEQALAADPAEPFAWARLSYLRLATQGDLPDAFAALRLSDLVSPGEPRQLPERALMWRHFVSVEDKDQQAYQAVLWDKAFRMQSDKTWQLAVQNHIVSDVGDALRQTDGDLYEEWKSRVEGENKKP